MAQTKWFAVSAAALAAAACVNDNVADTAVAGESLAAAVPVSCPMVGGAGEMGDCEVLPIQPGEACLAIWEAYPEFGEVTVHGGWPLGGGLQSVNASKREPRRYGCFGSNAEHGNLYVVGKYRGGDYWQAGAWRADMACDSKGAKRGYNASYARDCAGAPFEIHTTVAALDVANTGTQ